LSADRLLDHGSIRQAGRLLKSVERNIEDLHRTRETIRLLQLRGKVERLKGHGAAAGRHLEEALLLALRLCERLAQRGVGAVPMRGAAAVAARLRPGPVCRPPRGVRERLRRHRGQCGSMGWPHLDARPIPRHRPIPGDEDAHTSQPTGQTDFVTGRLSGSGARRSSRGCEGGRGDGVRWCRRPSG
jgi:hypothetical protein